MFSTFRQEAWSTQTIAEFMELGKQLRKRYPAYQKRVWRDLAHPTHWDGYVQELPMHTSSYLQTAASSSTPLDVVIVDQYIRLMKRCQNTDLRHVLSLPSVIELSGEGLRGCTTIQPYRSGDRYSLLVAYHDCIHWFCTTPDMDHHPIHDLGARPIQRAWTGPKVDDANSAVLTLLGIRCLDAGSAHIHQDIADMAVGSFRTRIIIELLCGNLNPPDDVVDYIRQEIRDLSAESGFCLDDSVPCWLRDEAVLPPPPIGDSFSPPPDDRKVIVECLWQMVFDVRLREPGSDCDLQGLWHHLRAGKPSRFFTRFYGVKFCERLQALHSDQAIKDAMGDESLDTKPLRAESAKWAALTEACRQFDASSDRRYVVLCAVPPGDDPAVTKIGARLNDRSDPLRALLGQACELFLRTLYSNLPKEPLPIDSYKRYEPPTGATYPALVSANPRARVPISRLSVQQ